MKVDIEGVIIRLLDKHQDNRGWLMELFRQDELDEDIFPAMAYVSMTRPGQSRGPHEHARQTDLFGFFGPSMFRVSLWDNRRESPTYGAHTVMEAGDDNNAVVIVPPGVVHGYRNIGDVDGLVFNAPNQLYAGKNRSDPVDEIRHEADPDSPFRLE